MTTAQPATETLCFGRLNYKSTLDKDRKKEIV
jgi:hypothetical protein